MHVTRTRRWRNRRCRWISPRTLSKIRNAECGQRYAMINTGLRFCNVDADRGARFRALRALRNEMFACRAMATSSKSLTASYSACNII
jgi:hypothetical protein